MMKETIIQQCLDVFKRNDIKNEVKDLFQPVIQSIFNVINPYMYIIMSLVILIFILLLGIIALLILVLRNKNTLVKID
jgi:hypothetical protein